MPYRQNDIPKSEPPPTVTLMHWERVVSYPPYVVMHALIHRRKRRGWWDVPEVPLVVVGYGLSWFLLKENNVDYTIRRANSPVPDKYVALLSKLWSELPLEVK